MPNKLGVSIVKYLCPICGKESDYEIIMSSLLTERNAKEVEELHNKTIGYAYHACKECSKYKDKVIFLIGIDTSKSIKTDPYKTGQIVGAKKHSILAKIVKHYTLSLEDGTQYCYIDKNVDKKLGL